MIESQIPYIGKLPVKENRGNLYKEESIVVTEKRENKEPLLSGGRVWDSAVVFCLCAVLGLVFIIVFGGCAVSMDLATWNQHQAETRDRVLTDRSYGDSIDDRARELPGDWPITGETFTTPRD